MASDSSLTSAGGAPAGAAGADGDWAASLTRLLERYVALVRDKAIRPLVAIVAVLALALGIVGLVLGSALAAIILAAVGVSRFVDVYLFRGHMWATDAFVGGIFLLGGVLLVAFGHRAKRPAA